MVSRWLWPGNRTFWEVDITVVSWWLVGFLHCVLLIILVTVIFEVGLQGPKDTFMKNTYFIGITQLLERKSFRTLPVEVCYNSAFCETNCLVWFNAKSQVCCKSAFLASAVVFLLHNNIAVLYVQGYLWGNLCSQLITVYCQSSTG